MKNTLSTKHNVTSANIALIVIIVSLIGLLLLTPKALGTDSVTGAIWTTDPNGERVNGNLFTNAKKVYLCGGPHKEGSAGLPDGIYYFQVTDPPGKTLLSTDPLEARKIEVRCGYIYSIDGGTHKWNNDTTRGYGIVVQLWPFTYTPSTGGVYKLWVTREDHYATPSQGCFGFISSLSKTDNFKVGRKLDEAAKYFELWMTSGISESPEVKFYVNYTTDGDGDPDTIDPVLPWVEGQLTWDRNQSGYDVFRYETTFAMDTYIYWKFFVLNTYTWGSEMNGPELIDREGMVNKEFLFMVNGHKYDYYDGSGLEGWTIELYKDSEKLATTQTGPDGEYEFFGIGVGDYRVCEIVKSDEGWANVTPTCHEFTIDGSGAVELTFDFYNHKMLRISDTSDERRELSSFAVVFTPSGNDPGMYKLSSTNPGSFYYNVVKYGTAGTHGRVEVCLPPDQENAEFDSPNFILHHTYIGSTPLIDVHVYAARASYGSEWVPDWSTDITSLFDIIPTADGKNVTISGDMPDTGMVFATVHIDFQISDSLTLDQVPMFDGFEYTFSATGYFSIQGVRVSFPVK